MTLFHRTVGMSNYFPCRREIGRRGNIWFTSMMEIWPIDARIQLLLVEGMSVLVIFFTLITNPCIAIQSSPKQHTKMKWLMMRDIYFSNMSIRHYTKENWTPQTGLTPVRAGISRDGDYLEPAKRMVFRLTPDLVENLTGRLVYW